MLDICTLDISWRPPLLPQTQPRRIGWQSLVGPFSLGAVEKFETNRLVKAALMPMNVPNLKSSLDARLKPVKDFIHKHERWEPLVLFVAGFTFDAFLLHRIDDPLMLVHQAIYLSLSAGIIAWDLLVDHGKANEPTKLGLLWKHREGLLHFMLGTLLNVYTIFYFKSGTFVGSLVFLLLLGTLLALNEWRPKKIPKHGLRNALFALCLLSYFNILVSIGVGSIGLWVFFLALSCAGLVKAGFALVLANKLDRDLMKREIIAPFAGVALVYASLYLLKVLPPVPLSVKHIGIYHSIKRVGSEYQLGYTRAKWRFWENGDQTFEAKPGDRLYCFVQIFSPTNFKETTFIRWQRYDAKQGWVGHEAIPFAIIGGREDGYRGFAVKENFEPGEWRVTVETRDGREIGRIKVDVVASFDPASNPTETFELR
jgi:hypothetical protein